MNIKKSEHYLPEDKDLLEQIEELHIPQNTFANPEHVLAVIQIKATLRNKKATHDLDVSTTRFSIVLAAFAFVQIVLGIYTFLFTAETSSHPYLGAFYALCMGILIYVIYKSVTKDLGSKERDKE
jgi:heme A synthase